MLRVTPGWGQVLGTRLSPCKTSLKLNMLPEEREKKSIRAAGAQAGWWGLM